MLRFCTHCTSRWSNSINMCKTTRTRSDRGFKLFPVLASHVINHPRARTAGKPSLLDQRFRLRWPGIRDPQQEALDNPRRRDRRSISRFDHQARFSHSPAIRPRSTRDGRLQRTGWFFILRRRTCSVTDRYTRASVVEKTSCPSLFLSLSLSFLFLVPFSVNLCHASERCCCNSRELMDRIKPILTDPSVTFSFRRYLIYLWEASQNSYLSIGFF